MNDTANQGGRPRNENPFSERVYTNLTVEQNARLQAICESEMLPVATVVRRMVLNAIDEHKD